MHNAFRRRGCRAVPLAAVVAGSLLTAATAEAAVVQARVTPTWQTNGRVEAIAVVGNVAYIGGKFTAVRAANTASGGTVRNHVAAINLSTNSLLAWNPNTNGTVQAIAVAGSTVYLGGSFTQVGGAGNARMAAGNSSTGAPVAGFSASMNAQVMTLTAANGLVYAGGNFTTVNGAARNYLVALNGTTGAVASGFAATADNFVLASTMTADGTRLIVGGDFNHIGSSSQSHIAALSPTTGATLSWSKHTPYAVIALAADAAGVYVAGAGNGGNFAGFSPASGAMKWQGGTNGNVQAITVAGGVVYPGGHFTNYCGPQGGQHTCTNPVVRNKILGVDENTGALTPAWAPSVNSALGIFSEAATGGGAPLIGGDFTKVAGTAQQGFAEFLP